MKLIIAEKPSVAKSIAGVLGCNSLQKGYIEGQSCIVTWTGGHLVTLDDPNSYNQSYKQWNKSDLPILPRPFKTKVISSKYYQYKVVKNLINDNRVDEIVCATDAGREGELIFRLVYDKIGTKKPFTRMWIQSMEDPALLDEFNKAKDGHSYDDLSESAKARQEADWLVGINLTRLVSIENNKKFTIGRVQTPTLNLINARCEEKENFKPEKYNTIQADINQDGKVITFETERIETQESSYKMSSMSSELEIEEVICEEKTTKAPKLYDLTNLQRAANKKYGLSAKQTLDIAQSLYEAKYISYPRTDSEYITYDMVESVRKLIGSHADSDMFDNVEKIANDKKVSDHTALLPTIYSIDKKDEINKLDKDHINIYTLIYMQLLKSVSKNYRYMQTKVTAISGDIKLYTVGKVEIDQGFKKLESEDDAAKSEKDLSGLEEGMSYPITETRLMDKTTKPPAYYNDDSLLKAMKTAGSGLYEKGLEIERTGLGTTATRADIIEGLIKNGYIARSKKYIVITELGKQLLSVAPDKLKEIELTVNWENELAKIAEGEKDKNSFIQEIENYLKDIVKSYEGDESLKVKESIIGTCPYCQGNVYINDRSINCENSKYGKNKGTCRLSTLRTISGHKLNEDEAKSLIEDGRTPLISDFISKKGNNFPAYVVLSNSGAYPTTLEFPDKKS
ncbi:topoisomerase C-terminal repeat-containing protein [Anaerococcus murdochii]|uniref:DNA topoisomerase n=1 Tax=Anaerococcus murdochii TaxID=411577 RepID=A0ABS7T0L1_9FIRM|nr:type IA DNA topoisomerase [Anaerococcus murdochii]MBZ2387317.1 topoisomerase C-terminal repeat-containing protein [Anaerococcus murdochii]